MSKRWIFMGVNQQMDQMMTGSGMRTGSGMMGGGSLFSHHSATSTGR